jgi:cyclomaltodextrinase
MPHKPQEELLDLIGEAKNKITLNTNYRHYKNQKDSYKVVDFVVIEDTDQIGVLYQAQYGKKLTFVRPMTSWLEKVEHNGQLIPRFSEI